MIRHETEGVMDINTDSRLGDRPSCLISVRITEFGGNRLLYAQNSHRRLAIFSGFIDADYRSGLISAGTGIVLCAPIGFPPEGWSSSDLKRAEHPGCCGAIHIDPNPRSDSRHRASVGLDADHAVFDAFLWNVHRALTIPKNITLHLTLALPAGYTKDIDAGELDLTRDYAIREFQLTA